MTLPELNDEILAKYGELVQENDITAEELLKSVGTITILFMGQLGAKNIELDDQIIQLTQK